MPSCKRQKCDCGQTCGCERQKCDHAHVKPCSGLQCSELEGLYEVRGIRKPTEYGGAKDVINYLWDLGLSQQFPDCATCDEFQAKHDVEYSKLLVQTEAGGRKLYYGNGEAVKSTFCSGHGTFNGCCLQCLVLYFQKRLHVRAASMSGVNATVGAKCNRRYMTASNMEQRLDDTNAVLNAEKLAGLNKARGWERCQRRYEKALLKLQKHSNSARDYPKFIRYLQEAFEFGKLDDHEALVDILTGISTCLRNGTRRGRTLSDSEKQFYLMLLNNTSPWAHKFVSGVMLGSGHFN